MSQLDEKGLTLSRSILRVQLAIASVILVATIAAPPADGAMIAVPIGASPERPVAQWATEANGKILGAGRIPGSLIILGDRNDLFAAAIQNRALLMRASAFLCAPATQETPK